MTDSRNDNDAPLVWTLCGGVSSEHDVSISSGRQVALALAGGKWRVRAVVIDRDGAWRLGAQTLGPRWEPASVLESLEPLLNGAGESVSCEVAFSRMREDAPACVFPALHGPGGEDGRLQGALDWLGAAYVGSGPAASALAMEKLRSQALFRLRGFNTPSSVSTLDIDPSARWERGAHVAALARAVDGNLQYPVFVKPGMGGSSLGMSRARTPEELTDAIELALDHADEVLIETAVSGRELTCGVLDIPGAEGVPAPQALAVTEIIPRKSSYFDYEAKYTAGATDEQTPADLAPEMTEAVRAAALKAHLDLGLSGLSRSDFFLGDDGVLYILETNTIPGMTPTSLLPQGAAEMGIPFSRLCELAVESALWKGARKKNAS